MSDRNSPNWEQKLEQKFKDLEAEINRETTQYVPLTPMKKLMVFLLV